MQLRIFFKNSRVLEKLEIFREFDSCRLHQKEILFYTYLLYSAHSDKFYIGYSSDLSNRLQQHNGGYVKSTKPYKPWILGWYEVFETRRAAMARERKLKNLKSQNRIINYIVGHGVLKEECSSEFSLKIRESSKN